MRHALKTLVLTTLAPFVTATAALASPVCMDAVEMEAALIDWYGETPVPGAWAADQQLWASEATGTWTLMQLEADDRACVLSQGEDWAPNDDPIVAFERLLRDKGDAAPAEALAFLDLLTSDAS
ncbi:S-adenosyl-L-homocysteine hydrolase [Tateyamaria omphalii]|uniref:S-adenosyl-L-homocysteine hydrolase n=1 Tax=Tateyamaria omphalii TaxID=299262 RepID=UPI001C9928C1|nr:S-adenosyl-L-homocysteine hydrolase [Tateyamaria omphalii]MBY5933432.1 S-adenosyl-L-homocysteine hydrolase [Tateyamaria omphalii]